MGCGTAVGLDSFDFGAKVAVMVAIVIVVLEIVESVFVETVVVDVSYCGVFARSSFPIKGQTTLFLLDRHFLKMTEKKVDPKSAGTAISFLAVVL